MQSFEMQHRATAELLAAQADMAFESQLAFIAEAVAHHTGIIPSFEDILASCRTARQFIRMAEIEHMNLNFYLDCVPKPEVKAAEESVE
jgi:hypothetical protein